MLDIDADEAGSDPDGAAMDIEDLEGLMAVLRQLLSQLDVHHLCCSWRHAPETRINTPVVTPLTEFKKYIFGSGLLFKCRWEKRGLRHFGWWGEHKFSEGGNFIPFAPTKNKQTKIQQYNSEANMYTYTIVHTVILSGK